MNRLVVQQADVLELEEAVLLAEEVVLEEVAEEAAAAAVDAAVEVVNLSSKSISELVTLKRVNLE